jgi:hypothetical protein
MRRLIYLLFIIVAIAGCKKTKFAPEGPTDVRVRNMSDVVMTQVIVKIKEEADTLGNVAATGGTSEYFRFEIAFPKAEISAKINGVLFTTGPVNSTYMQYIGQDRITYEVYISNMNSKELSISNVIVDEPLILK